MKENIHKVLSDLEEKGGSAAVCTVIKSSGSTPRHVGSKILVFPEGKILGSVGGGELEKRVIDEAIQAIQDGHPRVLQYNMTDPTQGDPGICGGRVEVFVDPVLPAPLLLIIGGGHVGKAVAHLAKWIGFNVAVSDERIEFCTPESNPDADQFYPVPMATIPERLEITPQTYIVLTTRGVDTDVAGLPALLDTRAGYIGVIGSRRRWSLTYAALIKEGISKEKLARVHSPIGLRIGAETPEEIAVSIMAEILMLRAGGSGKSMRDPE